MMTRTQPEWGIAPFIGALPAGIAFLLGPMILGVLTEELSLSLPGPEDVWAAIMISIFATVIGWVLAIVPAILGTFAMCQLGASALWARTRPAWAAAGLTIVLVPILTLSPAMLTDSVALVAGFCSAGIVCALACRHFVLWPEATTPRDLYRTEADPRLLH